MYNVCPKLRRAKATASDRVDHTWDNIVATTSTTIEVPGPTNLIPMDTEPRPQYVQKMKLPYINNEKSKLEQVPLERRQTISDTTPSHTNTKSDKKIGTSAAPQWADEEPELEQTPPEWLRTKKDVPGMAKEWSSLPQRVPPSTDPRNTKSKPTISVDDTDEKHASTTYTTDSCNEYVPDEFMRTGTIRKNKLRVDKATEKPQNIKRNRTKQPKSPKDKH
jgi:hypothetical protein